MVGNTKIELLEPLDNDGPVGKFIEKRGEGVHHIAFAVKNLEQQLAAAENAGIKLIDKHQEWEQKGLALLSCIRNQLQVF